MIFWKTQLLLLLTLACLALTTRAGNQAGGEAPTPAPPSGWRADPKLLADMDRSKVSWIHREEDVPAYRLPDPLRCLDGSRVSTPQEWERQRRPETLELFRKFVYGRSPARPASVKFDVFVTDPKAMGGKATLKRVRITSTGADGKTFAFEAAVLIPNVRKGPVPAFLLINNRGPGSADPTREQKDGFWPAEEIIDRGYAAAVFRTSDVDPDKDGASARALGVRGVWPGGAGTPAEETWASLAAWAWGASLVLDYLQTEPAIDSRRIAVVGHSRGGKTALWAAAQDERFALAVSNSSGRGGASLARRRFGERVEAINRNFPYWFCKNFHRFDGREDELPVDQHQLLALIAPRGVYVASADQDLWADPHGEFLSLAHAAPVYALYGHAGPGPHEMPPLDTPLVRGRVGYHIRRGGHNLTPYDWQRFLDFADRLWRAGRPPRNADR